MNLPKFSVDDNAMAEVSRKHKIAELALFGSVLRDDFSDSSDIDVLVQFAPDAHVSLFDLFEVKESLEKIFKRPVDLVEKAGIRNPFRKKIIFQTARIVYAA